MNNDSYNNSLFKFIEHSTCSFTCVSEIKNILISNGYKELSEGDKWDIQVGKYFVIRNDSSIIAFNIGSNYRDCFNIICSHGDTPGFSLKPNSEIYEYDLKRSLEEFTSFVTIADSLSLDKNTQAGQYKFDIEEYAIKRIKQKLAISQNQ